MALSTLRIFLCSPGDVAEERLIARRVIGRLGARTGDAVHLEAVFWEHQPLVATASFQEQLVRPSETDIVVVILWSRLGTVLPSHLRRGDGSAYASGTEFEFEDAVEGFRLNGKPEIMAYRKTAQAALPLDSELLDDYLRQKHELDRFVARWFKNDADGSLKGAFHSFASPADFEELLEAHLSRLVEQRLPAGSGDRAAVAAWREGSPFRGLEPFEPQHAPVFFGRTAAVASVLMKLRQQAEQHKAFVLIVSMSGGGKSSLIRAGVLPLLLQPGVVGEAQMWRYAIMRPSDGQGDLGLALVRALAQATALPEIDAAEAAGEGAPPPPIADAPAALVARVRQGLHEAARATAAGTASAPADCHLVLVVDQLEEIFSDERIDAAARARFVSAIDALARCGQVWVIATLRSDVYARLAELPTLIALKEGEGQFDLLAPTPREIGQIIRLPAAAAGLRFELRTHTAERLDETIRDAAAKNPAALPLLQFLLEELYKRRSSDDVLNFRAYEDLGGVEGALAQRAEAVLGGVSEAAQQTLPAVLRELVAFGTEDETKALRRVAPRGAFTTPQANELVDALLQARLLVSALDEHGQSAISMAHEALLEFWPRLRDWQEQDRELLHVHARLAAAARIWDKQGRGADFLLARGKPLAEASTLLALGMRLSPLEIALVQASQRRAKRFVRLRAGAISALAVLTVVASVAAYRANVESARAQVQATTAQRTSDFLVSLFAIADPEQNRGESVTVREILDRGVSEIQNGLSGELGVRANLLRAMGQAYNGLGLYPKARGLLQEALAQAQQSGIAADVLKAQLALAFNRYVDGDYAQAETLYRSALALARQSHGDVRSSVPEALTGLGDSIAERGQGAQAEALYREALAIDLKLHGQAHADTARSLNALAGLLYFQARYADAEPLFQRALSIRKALFGERHALVAQSLNNLGSLYFQTGRYEQASAVWTEALPVHRSVFGLEHREVATILNNLGRVELTRGQLAVAEAHFSEALAMDRRLLAAGHDDLVLPLNSLAMVLMARGSSAPAEVLLREALDIARARQHWLLDQVLGNLADLYIAVGRVPEGREALAEARVALLAQYGDKLRSDDAWRVAALDLVAASEHLHRRELAAAEKLLLGALPVLEARYGKRSFFTDQALRRLVLVYTASGNEVEAQRYRRRLAGAATT